MLWFTSVEELRLKSKLQNARFPDIKLSQFLEKLTISKIEYWTVLQSQIVYTTGSARSLDPFYIVTYYIKWVTTSL